MINIEKIYSPTCVINFLETGSSSILQQQDYEYGSKCSFLFSRDRVNHFHKQQTSLLILRKINEYFIDVVLSI